MKFELPFSNETINQLVGKTMILSEHHRNDSLFKPLKQTLVESGGDFGGGHLEVVDGVLRVMDEQGLCYSFDGLETRNGVVYAVGTSVRSISHHGYDRITLHEQKVLDANSFGICISSHINYAKTTLVPLLESIRKAKFDMAKVVVIVGGFYGEKTEVIEGATVNYQMDNGGGFNGLLGASPFMPYWLLMHDTCEMERSFLSLIGSIDIGLSQDVIRLRNDEDWMGFYSMTFINKIKDELTGTPNEILHAIKQHASVTSVIPGTITEDGKKDIYGTGNRRLVQKLNSVGIRKFKSLTGRRTP